MNNQKTQTQPTKSQKKLQNAWLIWGIAAVFYLYEMILRVSPSVMTNELMQSFDITSAMLGLLISFYYYSYTLLQIPCGLILDKLGPRNVIGISAILCFVGSTLFAVQAHIFIAQIGRLLIGAGSACAFISCLQISTSMFPTKYFSFLAGTTNMMGTLGGLFGGIPVAKLVNYCGWQKTTCLLSVLGLIIFAFIFIFVPKNTSINKTKNINTTSVLPILKKLITNSQIILSGLVAGFMYLPISAFSELWATPFFVAKYNISKEYASIASSILFVGVAIGSVVIVGFVKLLNNYVKTIRIASLLVAFLFVPIIYCDINMCTSLVIVFLLGFCTGAQVINFTNAKNNANKKLAGTTLALTNAIVMLTGSVLQPILGVILDAFWNGKLTETGIRLYDVSCYKHAIGVLPVCLLIACFFSLFIKDTKSLEQ